MSTVIATFVGSTIGFGIGFGLNEVLTRAEGSEGGSR